MTAEGIVTMWVLAGIAAIGGLVALLRVVWAAWQLRLLRRGRPGSRIGGRGPGVRFGDGAAEH